MRNKKTRSLEKAKAGVAAWNKAHDAGNGSKVFSLMELADSKAHADFAKAIQGCLSYNRRSKIMTLHFLYPYEVDLETVKTPLDLLGWAEHLLGKEWMDREYMRAFIRKVAAIKGWSIR